jgi:dipeptidyl aminopeptidase/acylaminoacyl peptidase
VEARRRSAFVGAWAACLAVLALATTPAHAAFPGANGKITFVRDGQIWVMNPDGSDATQLTSHDGTARGTPAWSADGRLIAFVRAFGTNPGQSVDYMNGDGSNVTFVGDGYDPSWSPDGSHIALSTGDHSFGSNNDRIFTLWKDGTFGDQVTSPPFGTSDYTPAWSPDGSKILFERVHEGGSSLWTAMPNGLALQRVNDSLRFESYPNWSPDGKRIAFRGESVSGTAVYIVNADGTGLTAVPNTNLDSEPAWSPDGTKLAVQHFPPPQPFGPTEIDLVDPVTGAHTSLTTGQHDSDPDWQPIIPNRPPDCSGVTASRPVLTTANRRLVPITLVGASDPDGDPVSFSLDGVTQDEPVMGNGDSTSPDAIDLGDGDIKVRAERNPHGDGRVYRIAFTASDGRGGSCSGIAMVSVPRKTRQPAVDSAPPSYDSLVP